MSTSILEGVNARQAEAIALTDGPLLIAAGAGTGKTRVITRRIAHLIAGGVEPWRILGITFTNKAAGEMKRRVETLTGGTSVFISTFHSFCAYLLRREAPAIGISRGFTIYDADDQRTALKAVFRSLGKKLSAAEIRDVARQVSDAKNNRVDPSEYLAQARTSWCHLVADAYLRYETLLAANNALDFDDLLLKALLALESDEDVRRRFQERFSHLLVDEFQDTNRCQYEIVRLLGERHRNVCVTGDPDQSIYSWRGASPENLFLFEQDFAESRFVALEQNYRSTRTILRAASGLVAHNRLRKDVTLWSDGPEGDPVGLLVWPDERSEASGIVRAIEARLDAGADPSEFAVLYRTNALSRSFEEFLLLAGIPYVLVGATEFFGRREIKDLLSYLRLTVNPTDDLSLRRVLNVPRRGIGAKTAEALDRRAAAEKRSLLDTLRDLPPGAIGRKAAGGLAELVGALDAATAVAGSVLDALDTILERTGFEGALGKAGEPETLERKDNVEELLRAAAEHERTADDHSVGAFLERVALLGDAERTDQGTGRVVHLMTLHAAKGLEFDVLFVAGCEDGLLPHFGRSSDTNEIEEERRLLYVGMTRARRELYLSRTEWRTMRGRREPARPSRFLAEIPADATVSGGRLALDRAPARPTVPLGADFARAIDAGSDLPAAGERVRHPIYGEGQIVDVAQWGQRTRVKVAFEGEGTKDMIYEHAQLTRL